MAVAAGLPSNSLLVARRLFLSRQHHLFSFAPSFDESLFAMLPFVLASSINSFELFAFDLCCLLNWFRNMPVAFHSPNLRHMLISALEGFIILELLTLACRLDSFASGGMRSPKPYISVIRSRENESRVWGECRRKGPMILAEFSVDGTYLPLHPLCVINISRVATLSVP